MANIPSCCWKHFTLWSEESVSSNNIGLQHPLINQKGSYSKEYKSVINAAQKIEGGNHDAQLKKL
jgi:hypothetical protein